MSHSLNELNSSSLCKSILIILKYRIRDYKIIIDEEGYVAVQDILRILRRIHTERKYITAFDIEHIVRADKKQRLEITKDLKKIKLTA